MSNGTVAPHMGAWIEIFLLPNPAWATAVAPHMGAWIEIGHVIHRLPKQNCRTPYGCVDWNPVKLLTVCCAIVAPHMGAWIEIVIYGLNRKERTVAPHMGAWIEINIKMNYILLKGSRTPYGCVDWNSYLRWMGRNGKVAPHMGAWIEIKYVRLKDGKLTSHPIWVRGLKFKVQGWYARNRKSHPIWVRGLKSYDRMELC